MLGPNSQSSSIDADEQEFNDSARRFGTRNTNLAACIAALRVPIKKTEPTFVVEDPEHPERGRIVTYFFEIESIKNDQGKNEKTDHINWAWNHWEEFKKQNQNHSLIPMRAGIDKYSWLTKVWHGNITPSHRRGPWNYSTSDITLAACIMVAGRELHSFAKSPSPEFRFCIAEPERERILEEFECFRRGTDPVCHARRALECRAELIKLVKRSPVLWRYTTGDPECGFREGHICKDVSSDKLRRFLELLYE